MLFSSSYRWNSSQRPAAGRIWPLSEAMAVWQLIGESSRELIEVTACLERRGRPWRYAKGKQPLRLSTFFKSLLRRAWCCRTMTSRLADLASLRAMPWPPMTRPHGLVDCQHINHQWHCSQRHLVRSGMLAGLEPLASPRRLHATPVPGPCICCHGQNRCRRCR